MTIITTVNGSAEAIVVYDDILARFGADDDLRVRQQLARALFNKAIALGTLGRTVRSCRA